MTAAEPELSHWYVMSIDLVRYSDLPGAQQVEAIKRLIASVREILEKNKSLKPGFFLPTGDGMIVGFREMCGVRS